MGIPSLGWLSKLAGSAQSHDKVFVILLLVCLPLDHVRNRSEARAKLQVRGGSFDFMARETGELCGIAEPEKAVVGAICGSALGRALGLDGDDAAPAAVSVRGGAFDFRARETGELCGIRKPEKAVVRAIKTQVGRFCRAIGLSRLRPAKLMLPPRRV